MRHWGIYLALTEVFKVIESTWLAYMLVVLIGHFRITFGLFFKVSPGAHRFMCKLVFICMWMKTNFPMKGWAPRLVLKKRPKVIRKWPIYHHKTFVSGEWLNTFRLPVLLRKGKCRWPIFVGRQPGCWWWYMTFRKASSQRDHPRPLNCFSITINTSPGGGGGILPYLGYTGTCRWTRYGFLASLS